MQTEFDYGIDTNLSSCPSSGSYTISTSTTDNDFVWFYMPENRLMSVFEEEQFLEDELFEI